jgi:hypothetical protein
MSYNDLRKWHKETKTKFPNDGRLESPSRKGVDLQKCYDAFNSTDSVEGAEKLKKAKKPSLRYGRPVSGKETLITIYLCHPWHAWENRYRVSGGSTERIRRFIGPYDTLVADEKQKQVTRNDLDEELNAGKSHPWTDDQNEFVPDCVIPVIDWIRPATAELASIRYLPRTHRDYALRQHLQNLRDKILTTLRNTLVFQTIERMLKGTLERKSDQQIGNDCKAMWKLWCIGPRDKKRATVFTRFENQIYSILNCVSFEGSEQGVSSTDSAQYYEHILAEFLIWHILADELHATPVFVGAMKPCMDVVKEIFCVDEPTQGLKFKKTRLHTSWETHSKYIRDFVRSRFPFAHESLSPILLSQPEKKPREKSEENPTKPEMGASSKVGQKRTILHEEVGTSKKRKTLTRDSSTPYNLRKTSPRKMNAGGIDDGLVDYIEVLFRRKLYDELASYMDTEEYDIAESKYDVTSSDEDDYEYEGDDGREDDDETGYDTPTDIEGDDEDAQEFSPSMKDILEDTDEETDSEYEGLDSVE